MENNELLQKLEKLEQKVSDLENRKSGFRKYFGRAFRKTNVIAGIIITVMIASAVLFAAQITFTDGTVISAADVNNNFNDLYASKWSKSGSNYFVTDGNVGIGIDNPLSKLEVNGTIKASNVEVTGSIFGVLKQHQKNIRLSCTATTTVSDIDLGLDETNAKYLVASVAMYNSTRNDAVNHILGYNLPSWASWDNQVYLMDDSNSSNYVILSFNGDSAGPDYYGKNEFVIIPLKNNHRIDAKLCDGYSQGTHYVTISEIGYFE